MYEFTGKVKAVGEVQTFASGFTKRELVVEEDREGNWPNVVAFAFKKDNVAKLDGVKPGMRVKVGFAVDGREWTDPKTGKVRYFSDLTAPISFCVTKEKHPIRTKACTTSMSANRIASTRTLI